MDEIAFGKEFPFLADVSMSATRLEAEKLLAELKPFVPPRPFLVTSRWQRWLHICLNFGRPYGVRTTKQT